LQLSQWMRPLDTNRQGGPYSFRQFSRISLYDTVSGGFGPRLR
jgi:hypothetical protein